MNVTDSPSHSNFTATENVVSETSHLHRARLSKHARHILLGALAISLLAHAAILVGTSGLNWIKNESTPTYVAKVDLIQKTIEPEPVALPAQSPQAQSAAKPMPKPAPKPRVAPKPKAPKPIVEAAVNPSPIVMADATPSSNTPALPADNDTARQTPTDVPMESTETTKPTEDGDKDGEKIAMAKPDATRPEPQPAEKIRPQDPAQDNSSRFDEFVLPKDKTRLAIRYHASSSVVDGVGSYEFKRTGNQYTISGDLQASGFLAEVFGGRIEQKISGEIAERHMRTARATSVVGSNPEESLNANWDTNQVSFTRNGNTRSESLTPTSTDVMSFIFGFAVSPPPDRLTEFSIMTPRGQDAYRYEFAGEETLETSDGPKETMHIVIYGINKKNTRYDAWLSKTQGLAPIKLKFPVANGRVMFELTAKSVSIG